MLHQYATPYCCLCNTHQSQTCSPHQQHTIPPTEKPTSRQHSLPLCPTTQRLPLPTTRTLSDWLSSSSWLYLSSHFRVHMRPIVKFLVRSKMGTITYLHGSFNAYSAQRVCEWLTWVWMKICRALHECTCQCSMHTERTFRWYARKRLSTHY